MRPLLPLLAGGLLCACFGCAPSAAPTTAGPVKLDQFCTLDGLAAPLRQTVVVIDERALVKGGPAEMRTRNPELFQLVLGLGDPAQGVSSGAMAPRERLSLFLAPADGSAPRPLFTGCAPGVSAAELKTLKQTRSAAQGAADSYFGQGIEQRAQEGSEVFLRSLLAALVSAGKGAQPGAGGGGFAEGSLVRSLQSVPHLAAPENGLPRLFLFTDLDSFTPGDARTPVEARKAGFAAAEQVHISLDRAELHLVGRSGAQSPLAREFAQAFFLGSQASLQSWGGGGFNAMPPAPVRVQVFSGTIQYPPNAFPVQFRIAADRNGALVDSWIVVKTDREYATPVTGQLTCPVRGSCHLAGDQGGLAQAWSLNPDPKPEFSADLPLSGLRNIEADVGDDRITGRVFDPAVSQIGSVPHTEALSFDATRPGL